MKKKNIFIFLFTIFSFFSFSTLVFAEECTYTLSKTISGDKDDNITATCDWTTCSSFWGCDCTVKVNGKSNNESTASAADWYKENNTCLPYVVFLNRHALAGYELSYATSESDAQSTAQKLLSINGTDASVYILKSDALGHEKKTEEQEVLQYIENLKNYGKFFTLDDYCELSSDGVYMAVTTGSHRYDTSLCRSAKSAAITKIQEWDEFVKKNTSKISKNVAKEYEDYRNIARKALGYCTDCGDQAAPDDDPSITIVDKVDTKPSQEDKNIIRTCISCGEVLDNVPANLPKFVRGIVTSVQVLVPVILILLGMYDFLRAVMSNDEKAMKESQGKFVRRLIASVAIFFIVAIVKFGFGLVPSDTDVLGCIPCFITSDDSCGASYDCNSKLANNSNSTSNASSSSSSINAIVSGGASLAIFNNLTTGSNDVSQIAQCKNKGRAWIVSSGSGKCVSLNEVTNESDCKLNGYDWTISYAMVAGGYCK